MSTATHLHSRRGAWSPTYYSWAAMKRRCMNPGTNPRHRKYVGISFDPRWAVFTSFLEDMGERPVGTSIDRINPTQDYGKENCRWATAAQQAQNTCNSKLTAGCIVRIRDLLACGVTHKRIGAHFEVSRTQIGYIANNRQWRKHA